MQLEYLGNDRYNITLTSGVECTFTVDDWNELSENSFQYKDKEQELQDALDTIEELRAELSDYITPATEQVKLKINIKSKEEIMKNYIGIVVAMGAARQLIKGSTTDRLVWLQHHLPQKAEDGQLVNYLGEAFMETDLEDQEFVKAERLNDAKVITDALLNDLFSPLNQILLDPKRVAEPIVGGEATFVINKEVEEEQPDEEVEEKEDLDISDEIAKLEKAIKKGKVEKAEKILKSLKDDLDKDTYKTYKKQVKGL